MSWLYILFNCTFLDDILFPSNFLLSSKCLSSSRIYSCTAFIYVIYFHEEVIMLMFDMHILMVLPNSEGHNWGAQCADRFIWDLCQRNTCKIFIYSWLHSVIDGMMRAWRRFYCHWPEMIAGTVDRREDCLLPIVLSLLIFMGRQQPCYRVEMAFHEQKCRRSGWVFSALETEEKNECKLFFIPRRVQF